MPYLPSLDDNATAFDVFAHFPEYYEPFAAFCQQVLREAGPLEPRDRELIFAYVSGLNACQYCFGGHAQTAKLYGVDDALFEQLQNGIDEAPVDEPLKPLLRYAKKLTEMPSRIVAADSDAIYGAGWDEAALHSVIAITCLANYMNRLVEGCGVRADPAAFAKRGELAKQFGYLAPFQQRMQTRGTAGS